MRLTFVILLKAVAATFEPLNLPVTRGSNSKRIRYNAGTNSPQFSSRHCIQCPQIQGPEPVALLERALMASGEPISNISPLD